MDRPRFHPTELELYCMCPFKYRLQIEKKIEPPVDNWPRVRGSIIHDVCFHGLHQFDAIFESHLLKAKNLNASEEQIVKDRSEMWEQCSNYFLYLLHNGIDVLKRELQIDYFVKLWEFDGTIDAIAKHQDTPEGMVEIHDYKTGLKWGNRALDRKLQFGHYYIAAEQAGYSVNRVFWGHFKDLTPYKKDGKHGKKGGLRGKFLYPVKIGRDDLPFIHGLTADIVQQILKTEYRTMNFYGANAPCNFCEYADNHCPKFKIGTAMDFESLERAENALEEEMVRRIENGKD